MRLMMRFTIPVEKGNETAPTGEQQRAIEKAMEMLNAEAAYFHLSDGLRAGTFVFEATDPAPADEPIPFPSNI